MNSFEELMTDYNGLTYRCRKMIEQEMQHLKATGDLDENLLEAKQQLVSELESKLHELVLFRQSSFILPVDLKSELDEVQHKFMQVIKLDRELEKIYLSLQHAGSRKSARNSLVDMAGARRTYGAF